jgi:regulator of sigma E protease
MNLLFTLAAFAVALGVLIVIHEMGHFLVARWCGVKVLRFSVGFGKPLYVKRFGADGTEWAIGAFPLGGYVKMLDEREGEVAAHELPQAFNRQSVYRRSAIVVAGPLANLLLAILLYWVLFLHGVPGVKPVLGEIPAATAAAAAGFQPGEVLSRIDGQDVITWQDVRWVLLKRTLQNEKIGVEVHNEQGETATRQLDLGGVTSDDLEGDFLEKLGLTHFRPELKSVVEKVLPGGAAAKGGLAAGDAIVAVNGQPVSLWEDVVKEVRQSPSRPLKFEVKRADGLHVLQITPDAVVEEGKSVGKIGAMAAFDKQILQRLMTEVRYGPLRALGEAFVKTWDTSVFSLKMMGKMVFGEVSWRNISGPITIADYAGQSANLGWVPYLSFLALISISLGVLNLLPIPLLDGGHLMYYMAEFIKGSPVTEKTMEIGQQIGFALLMTLMAFAFYNDINRLLTN